MDPLTVKIVLVGTVLIGIGFGTDLALELTGHSGSELLPMAVKVATVGLSLVSMVLAGLSGQGANPPKTMRALLFGPPKPPPPPTAN